MFQNFIVMLIFSEYDVLKDFIELKIDRAGIFSHAPSINLGCSGA